ncbi:prepilin-type N-terminal cleavage/methylation domain-containing protein [Halarcobacter sp.]|uniref:prepilin-type N-terminal cleavage/methylation domain-containing protein n=1 Tax=Halarcobacter sp. TaxID=2321133 RepID=UPI003AFFBBE4
MKKAFSLIEIIIVIVVISIIASFLISKYATSINSTVKTTVKADIALINSAISKKNSKNILLQKSKITYLDNAITNQKGLEIFDNILQVPLLSTNMLEKELGKWIKVASDKYRVYISKKEYLEYRFKDDSFSCVSDLKLCKEFE